MHIIYIYIYLIYDTVYIANKYLQISPLVDAWALGALGLHIHPGPRQLLRAEELAQGAVLEGAQQSQDQKPGEIHS